MEKLANFLLEFLCGLWERLEYRKARQEHADAVRSDPGSAWLRRFGGKDARKQAAGSGVAKRDSN